MRYIRIVSKIAKDAEIPQAKVRLVVKLLAKYLMDLQPGDGVRTPLGRFYGKFRKPKKHQMPDGTTVMTKPEFFVKLREGKHLSRKIDSK